MPLMLQQNRIALINCFRAHKILKGRVFKGNIYNLENNSVCIDNKRRRNGLLYWTVVFIRSKVKL